MDSPKRHQTLKSWIASAAILGSFLCNGMIISIQANIYDALVEKSSSLGISNSLMSKLINLKDTHMTYYGILFGIFKLTVFISSTLFSKYLSSFGVRKVFIGGLVISSMTIILGIIAQNKLHSMLGGETLLIILATVRIIGAVGTTIFFGSSFAIMKELFSKSIGTVFAMEQLFLATGILIGQHCSTPIQLLGFALLVFTFISSLTLPSFKSFDSLGNLGIPQALKKSQIALSALSVFSASIAIRTLHTAADRHLTLEINLTAPQIKYFFMMYTLICALVTPFWGFLSDKIDPKFVILLGSFQTSLGFVLLGPLPPTGLQASHSLSFVSLLLTGSGIVAQLVSAFKEVQTSAVANGFPTGLSTSFLMASIWTAAFALGAFIGPVTEGILFDHIGFAWSTLFVVGWNVLVCLCSAQYLPAKLNTRDIRTESDEEKRYLLDRRHIQQKHYENMLTPLGQSELDCKVSSPLVP